MSSKIDQKKAQKSKNLAQQQFNPIYYKLLFVVVILFLYGRSIGFDFVLDDDLFIKNNPLVQNGISGIGQTFFHGSLEYFRGSNLQVYRPMLLTAFCIEKAMFGNIPGGFHFINVLLYVFTSIVFFSLIRKLLPNYNPFYAFIITMLFVIHPIHSEVVANIKSQDELLSTLFCLLALSLTINVFENNGKKSTTLILALCCYLIALFSKESAVAFVIIFPLAFYLLKGSDLKKTFFKSLPFFGAALLFVFIRHETLKNIFQGYETTVIENVLYGAKGMGEQIGTRLSILLKFLSVMILPISLSWDYSYNQIPIVGFNSIVPWISISLYVFIGVVILTMWKKRPEVAFGFSFFLLLITPTANIFFLNGTTFADRFLFLPSAGFIMAIVAGILFLTKSDLKNISKPLQKRINVISLAVFLIFSGLTISRCGEWKNNLTLFESAVVNTPNSSRVNAGLATEYMNKAEKETDNQQRKQLINSSIQYFSKSLSIYPDNSNASFKLGLIYAIIGDTTQSISYYRFSLKAKPDYVLALNNLAALYVAKQNYDSAIYFFNRSFQSDSLNEMTLTNLAVVNNIINNDEKVVYYGTKALDLNFGSAKLYNVLSQAMARKGDLEASQKYLQLMNSTTNVVLQ